jgi:hypothetical protein
LSPAPINPTSLTSEPIVDPPTYVKARWLLKPFGFYQYAKARFQRDIGTAQQ